MVSLTDIKLANSPAYRRAQNAGFTFYDIEQGDSPAGKWVRLQFKCVCGQVEIFCSKAPLLINGEWDAAQELENRGAFSENHLRQDGFTDAQIKEITERYWA